MPRRGRIQSGTGVYHVMMRGINRQRIFEDSEDHYTFLQCLRSAQEQYTPLGDRLPNSCHYYAYALMSNHFHILLHAKEDTVGNIVKRIASSYVYYFNRKYGRDGHQQINKIMHKINTRPREKLKFSTPRECFYEKISYICTC